MMRALVTKKHLYAPMVAVFAIALSFIAKSDAGPGPGHRGATACYTCHLNDPDKSSNNGRLLYTDDFSVMCSKCHPGAKALSHPVGMFVLKKLPGVFPLDWKKQMTCVTCHFFHKNEEASFLRVGKGGKEFCLMCHDMEFFRKMRDRGEALVGAHLASRSTRPKHADIVDEVSVACLSCHDGTVSIDVVGDIMPSGGLVSHSRNVSHPIGVQYRERAQFDDSYTPPEMLPPEVHLPNGKLGCTSCHAPYKEKHGSLVMSNVQSKLCLTCHKK